MTVHEYPIAFAFRMLERVTTNVPALLRSFSASRTAFAGESDARFAVVCPENVNVNVPVIDSCAVSDTT